METEARSWYVRSADGNVYGPARLRQLQDWVCEGRVEPGWQVSKDMVSWTPAQSVDLLGMRWLIEVEPGRVYGPFHRDYLIRLSESGLLTEDSRVYCRHDGPVGSDPAQVVVEKIVEKVVVKEVRVEVPVPVESPRPVGQTTALAIADRHFAVDVPRRSGFWNLFGVFRKGLFKDVESDRLAVIEQAARIELAALKRRQQEGAGGTGGEK